METGQKIGLAALALLIGASFALRTPSPSNGAPMAKAHMRLASLTAKDRHNVDYRRLDERLRHLMAKPAMVGLAVGVVEDGRITFLQGYGETLAGSGDPVTPQTVFRWASVSKGVASTMVAKLAQQGKIDLNAPVVNYAPDLILPNGNQYRASVGDLLSHRLGLYRNAYDNKLEEGHSPAALRRTLGALNAICPPGTCWSYQNVAYDASSEMVSRVTSMPYEQSLARYLFNPLGMDSASASLGGLTSSRSWARPHGAGGKPLPLVDTYYKVPASGGVNSDIKDLSLWMLAQMGAMPDVLDAKLLGTIQAPLVKTPTERRRLRKFLERLGDAYYGYGWRSYNYAGHRIVGHRGGINGYRSLILFDPQMKSGVVALWNSNAGQPGGLEFEVMDMIYRLPFRDWMELDKSPGEAAPAAAEEEAPVVAAAPAAPRKAAARS